MNLINRIKDWGFELVKCGELPPEFNGYAYKTPVVAGYAAGQEIISEVEYDIYDYAYDYETNRTSETTLGFLRTPNLYIRGRWGAPISWLNPAQIYSRDGRPISYEGRDVYFKEDDFELNGFNCFGEDYEEYMARVRPPLFGEKLLLKLLDYYDFEIDEKAKLANFPLEYGLLPVNLALKEGKPLITVADPSEAAYLAIYQRGGSFQAKALSFDFRSICFYLIRMDAAAMQIGIYEDDLRNMLVAELYKFLTNEAVFYRTLHEDPFLGGGMWNTNTEETRSLLAEYETISGRSAISRIHGVKTTIALSRANCVVLHECIYYAKLIRDTEDPTLADRYDHYIEYLLNCRILTPLDSPSFAEA